MCRIDESSPQGMFHCTHKLFKSKIQAMNDSSQHGIAIYFYSIWLSVERLHTSDIHTNHLIFQAHN